MKKTYITDIDECERLWKKLISPATLSDVWEFRACFHKNYNHSPFFVVLEDREGIAGMAPLCCLEEEDRYVFFPGETWNGRTWLERTQLYLRNKRFTDQLISECPDNSYLRYMRSSCNSETDDFEIDEIAYTLDLEAIDFDISRYLQRFSTKRLKGIRKDIEKLTEMGVCVYHNRLDDFDKMVDWNVERYENNSYFFDPRFRESFRDIMNFLYENGMLYMVSMDIKGETAAVDFGAVYNSACTIYAGGTNAAFPCIAKAINMYHIETAFSRRLSQIDFLCGDFTWKKLWHLDQEPLFKYVSPSLRVEMDSYISTYSETPAYA